MSKMDAILNGIKIGIFGIDVLLAVNAFIKGDAVIGILFILVGIIMLSTMKFRKKPRFHVEVHKISGAEAKEFDKIISDLKEGRLYPQRKILYIIDLLNHLNTINDNPDYKKGFDACKKICLEIIKAECDLKDGD